MLAAIGPIVLLSCSAQLAGLLALADVRPEGGRQDRAAWPPGATVGPSEDAQLATAGQAAWLQAWARLVGLSGEGVVVPGRLQNEQG